MDVKEFVKFLNYETDLNRFFDTTAGYCITNRVLPTQYEVQKIKIALAVSDQIEGWFTRHTRRNWRNWSQR